MPIVLFPDDAADDCVLSIFHLCASVCPTASLRSPFCSSRHWKQLYTSLSHFTTINHDRATGSTSELGWLPVIDFPT